MNGNLYVVVKSTISGDSIFVVGVYTYNCLLAEFPHAAKWNLDVERDAGWTFSIQNDQEKVDEDGYPEYYYSVSVCKLNERTDVVEF